MEIFHSLNNSFDTVKLFVGCSISISMVMRHLTNRTSIFCCSSEKISKEGSDRVENRVYSIEVQSNHTLVRPNIDTLYPFSENGSLHVSYGVPDN